MKLDYFPVVSQAPVTAETLELPIDYALLRRWLVQFLRDEILGRCGMDGGIVGLSGGVDSSVVAYLAVEAFGPENVFGVCMPYGPVSSPTSLAHAQLVIQQLDIGHRVIDIAPMVDGYGDPSISPARRGNLCARLRMAILYDLSQKSLEQGPKRLLPLGTGNKSERLLGYFTWHGDDAPPINPLGDVWKTWVWGLARHLGVPTEIVEKPASADLIVGQTDEGDLKVTYPVADKILYLRVERGWSREEILGLGFAEADVDAVLSRLESTHFKRELPIVAMVTQSSIGDSYLRTPDYRAWSQAGAQLSREHRETAPPPPSP